MAISDGSPYRDSYFLVDGHIWSMEGVDKSLRSCDCGAHHLSCKLRKFTILDFSTGRMRALQRCQQSQIASSQR